MNPQPGWSDKKTAHGKLQDKIKKNLLASDKKAKETFKKLKAKRKKK